MRPIGTDRGSTRDIRRPTAVVALLAAVLGLGVPSAAQAITVSGTAAPSNLQAGAHSDFQIDINLAPTSEDGKDLTVGLPPGEVGDPTAAPLCTVAQLNASTAGSDGCPAASQVGSVVANATITVVVLPVTLNVSGKIYNLTPKPGE